MKKNIVSYLFVFLGIAAIITNFYFAKQNLREIAKQEAESRLLKSDAPVSPQGRSAKAISMAGKTKKITGMAQEEQARPQKLIDLQKPADEWGHIPDDHDYSKDEAEDIETQGATATGDLVPQEAKPRVEPDEAEIHALKAKGVIIR